MSRHWQRGTWRRKWGPLTAVLLGGAAVAAASGHVGLNPWWRIGPQALKGDLDFYSNPSYLPVLLSMEGWPGLDPLAPYPQEIVVVVVVNNEVNVGSGGDVQVAQDADVDVFVDAPFGAPPIRVYPVARR